MRRTLRAFQERLDPSRFLRVSRSAIVNVDEIAHVEHDRRGDWFVILKTGERIESKLRYRRSLKELLQAP